MKRARVFYLIFLALMTSHAMAGESDIAQSCAETASKNNQLTHYEFIGVSEQLGSKRYRVWLNASNEQTRVYCEVDNGQVNLVVDESGAWDARNLRVPSAQALAVR